jgi:hypothetical protein
MIQAAKAFINVSAGVLPASLMPEYSKRWVYTVDDYEADRFRPEGQETTFAAYLREAYDYAKSITNPAVINWVKVEFMWV